MSQYLAEKNLILQKSQWTTTTVLACFFIILFLSSIVFYYQIIDIKVQKNKIVSEVLNELEKERSRISRELHDTVAQDLRAACIIQKTNSNQNKILELQQNAIKQIRSICYQLNPPGIENGKLDDLLAELCDNFQKNTNIECSLHLSDDNLFNTVVGTDKLNIFRIVQESLTNVEKHSRATSVVINARKSKLGIVIFISDNGKGFDIQSILKSNTYPSERSHFGLTGIQQRVKLLNGKLKITSSAESGTEIRVEV